jgi:glutathione S-transferase
MIGWVRQIFARENKPKAEHDIEEWLSAGERLLSSFNVACALAAVTVFLLGTAIQMSTPRYPELDALVERCAEQSAPAPDACRMAVLDFDRISHRAGDLSWRL